MGRTVTQQFSLVNIKLLGHDCSLMLSNQTASMLWQHYCSFLLYGQVNLRFKAWKNNMESGDTSIQQENNWLLNKIDLEFVPRDCYFLDFGDLATLFALGDRVPFFLFLPGLLP